MDDAVPSRQRRDAVTSRLRLRNYDYALPGTYFVTICTEGRRCLFGEVHDSACEPNLAGRMVEACWNEVGDRFPTVVLDAAVVMPNHFHAIIMLPY